MNVCPYTMQYMVPRNIQAPRRSSGIVGFIIIAILFAFLLSELYVYAEKLCMDHQRRMKSTCVAHQVALENKFRRMCECHKVMLERRLEEIKCKCNCNCERENDSNSDFETNSELEFSDEKESESESESVSNNGFERLDTIPEETELLGERIKEE